MDDDSKSAGIGKGTPGPGRGKGTPNRSTVLVREAIAVAAEASAPKIQAWLDAIEDPSKRMDCFLKMIEYHIPKLGRVEHTGADGGAMMVQILASPTDENL